MNAPHSSCALHWLPPADDFTGEAAGLAASSGDKEQRFASLRRLAEHRLDFLQTRRLSRMLSSMKEALPADIPRLRLALLGSMTLDHLVPSIEIGALRRGLVADIEVAPYGQWRQQILDPQSRLYAFEPECVLLATDMSAILPELPLDMDANAVDAAVNDAADALAQLWHSIAELTGAAVIQEMPWLDGPGLYGHFESQVPASPGSLVNRLNLALQSRAAAEGVLLLDLRSAASRIGTDSLSDETLWHHAKQAVSPAAAPWVGDHIGRILAAIRGLSKKVLVLDLDNTLWGGVIGDDGLDGIVIGQGSAGGEAFAAFQKYAKRLAGRGVVLAVSSKNDEEIARSAFREHPEMVLRLDDFAAFEANWNDKPAALRRMAKDLSLGLDSFVFVDDNPVERALMRQALPQVAVPELPQAPEHYARCLADAGYFEAVSFTTEDTARNAQYVANRARREFQADTRDIESFLRDLQMTLTVAPFRSADVPRIAQLINKTNQFNLTTRRYTETEVRAFMQDADVLTFTGRVSDRFGDNGLTSIVICRPAGDGAPVRTMEIDTWLMSCRVLGRRIEHAMLAAIAKQALDADIDNLLGRYIPTKKNALVSDLLPNLGFTERNVGSNTGESTWVLPLRTAQLPSTDHLQLVCEQE